MGASAEIRVLGAIAYGEWKAYEKATNRAEATDDEAERRAMKKVAAEELRHHKGFVRRLEAIGADPERTMSPYRDAVDSYHGARHDDPVAEAMWGYRGGGSTNPLRFLAFLGLGRPHVLMAALVSGWTRRLRAVGVDPIPLPGLRTPR